MVGLFSYDVIQKVNDTDLYIYKYIMGNKESVVYMTIRELVRSCNVSPGSIMRFSEKMGCEGYSDLRNGIRDLLSEGKAYEPRNDVKEILGYFERTYTEAFEEMIEQAAEMIRDAEKLIFIGVGGSGILAEYGARYFTNSGKFALSISDPYYPILEGMGDITLIIALSVTGESELLISQLRDCRKMHYKILSITNSADSTIAKMSDQNISCNLSIHWSEKYNGNLTTQVPVMFLLEILARSWAESA